MKMKNPLLPLPILLAAALTTAFAQDMPLSGLLVENEGWEVVSSGHTFTDGLCADAEGNLYFSDVKAGTAVYKMDLEGALTEFIADAEGRYYVTSAEGLQVFDPTGRLCGVITKPQDSNLVSVGFAGPGLDYLHIACGDTIFRRKTQTRGALFFQPPPL